MARNFWHELLFPDEEEKDPQFRARIDRLSVIGLRVIAAVCISGALYGIVTAWFFGDIHSVMGGWTMPLTILTMGVLAAAFSFWPRGSRYARWVGTVVGYSVAVVQFLSISSIVERPEVGYFVFSGIVTGVMLIGMAALPLKPMQVLALGGAIAGTYMVVIPLVAPRVSSARGLELVFGAQVVLLCTGLTAVVYHQRVLAHRARRSAEDALEELRAAQARLLVSENAHAQSRFAAALSHELNTPLGALTSAFDTVLHLLKKYKIDADERVSDVLEGAEKAGRGSAARLRETIARMRYLTNLDRAEEQTIDLNELCQETAASLREELESKAELVFDLETLQRVRCRPQQIGAVLSNLLRNAAAAIKGTGRITVVTHDRGDEVEIEVRDDGRGIPKEQLDRLFEPTFHVEGTRVATKNWGLFVCRTIVNEHGGHLDVVSQLGAGTTARVSLPVRLSSEKREP